MWALTFPNFFFKKGVRGEGFDGGYDGGLSAMSGMSQARWAAARARGEGEWGWGGGGGAGIHYDFGAVGSPEHSSRHLHARAYTGGGAYSGDAYMHTHPGAPQAQTHRSALAVPPEALMHMIDGEDEDLSNLLLAW